MIKTNISFGLTSVEETDKFLSVSHNGNMGNTIERSVNPNLKQMGFQSIAKMKAIYPKFKETGSPDYSYFIKFKKAKGARPKSEQTRELHQMLSCMNL